jgi:type VI secretion system protein ImpA
MGESDGGALPAPSAASPLTPPLVEVPAVTPPAAPPASPLPPPVAAPAAALPPDTMPAPPAAVLDPAVAALCVPFSEADPCGPDLDLDGDAAYLNFFADAESTLPRSFFTRDVNDKSSEEKPFDPATVDLPGQVAAIKPLLERTRDLRLLITRARLLILNRDLAGFAVTVAAIAEWLDKFWDAVHPRPQDDNAAARLTALAALDLPTVVFPLQYAPLAGAGRIVVTYRAWMIAAGEVKARSGEQRHSTGALSETMADADPAVLAASRRHVAMLKAALSRIRDTFAMRGKSCGLESLPALVGKMSAFVDPLTSADDQAAAEGADAPSSKGGVAAPASAGAAPTSLGQARDALAAVADYYSRAEPSSPTLPLVRQAHQLIGKSFLEVISILVPTQMEKAAFQIGVDQVFELPVGRLSKLSEATPAAGGQPAGVTQPEGPGSSGYSVQSRVQALGLLEQVQRYFRAAEPSSPVPMLCERARALAERDFMGVLRDVLPKAALKNPGADK